ncbi:hypothetical protein H6P81_016397 [Aristolochia fimbriata]|uniref:SAC3/GANP/THP3 conserved domain-containing protein n=1 Tax=Aristolochia fimbriata TaxID=158543 RepID=A0AAV7E885_ARIFI|nr:hypothetical protein H6P81_016397 [Aristolochia fimbriata]
MVNLLMLSPRSMRKTEDYYEEGEVHNFTAAVGTNCLRYVPGSAELLRIQASDIRPQDFFKTTLKYLIDFLDSSVHPYEVVHDFVFDKTRSIRQDITLQNIKNDDAIHMYEDMVKFYVLSHNKLAKPSNSSNIMSLLCLN